MGEVALSGRTVLFVSHNMHAVAQLTTTVVMLEQGRVAFHGSTAQGIARYTLGVFGEKSLGQPYIAPAGKTGVHVAAARVETSDELGEHVCTRSLALEFDIQIPDHRDGICFAVQVCDDASRPVCHFSLLDRGKDFQQGPGVYRVRCSIPSLRLYMGRYTLTTWLADRRGGDLLETVREICPFEVSMRGIVRKEYDWAPNEMVYMEDAEWGPVAPVSAERLSEETV
jgi:lipopolysaccharide transport system ATP-binding protein